MMTKSLKVDSFKSLKKKIWIFEVAYSSDFNQIWLIATENVAILQNLPNEQHELIN